jgi:RES domain
LSLPLPDKKFAKDAKLGIQTINPDKLVRVSRFESGEPYFGKSGANRFDDPRKGGKRFGTCYFGVESAAVPNQGLRCAFAETVLHDRRIDLRHGYGLAETELDRYVYRFTGKPLKVAVMYGDDLLLVGGDGRLSTEKPYTSTQQWALMVFKHGENVDGFLYKSRHTDSEALVLFDRAGSKLKLHDPVAFRYAEGAADVLIRFQVHAT